jgi:SAM-dependent methyltransferase
MKNHNGQKKESINHHEFYDLEDLQLNIDPNTNERFSSWGNLGYWKRDSLNLVASTSSDTSALIDTTYPQACEYLAIKLAQCAELDQLPDSHLVLDTGFGCGDQLFVWHQQFSVTSLYGMNYSASQTALAQKSINTAKIEGFTVRQADACDAIAWQAIPGSVDRILALDCVYHFHNKSFFFDLCETHLASDGILAISDLLLTKPLTNPFHKLILKLICKLSHIPFCNLMTEEDVVADLSSRGLKMARSIDISDAVFLPFGEWLSGHIQQVKKAGLVDQKSSWIKYQATARFLRWAYTHQVLSYRLLQIRKVR